MIVETIVSPAYDSVVQADRGVTKPAYPIESVDKALSILLMLRDEGSLRVSDAAVRLGVARSTAHRLLATLQYRGFVAQDKESRAYRLGPALRDIGLAAVGHIDAWRVGRPVLERLSRQLDESVHFGVLEDAQVLFVDGVESTRALRAGSRVGVRLPAHCTAAGKAMLAQLDSEEVRDRLPARLAPRTARSLTRRADLEQELARVRSDGFATNFGESEEDLVALAVAVGPQQCIVVTVPASRADREAWIRSVAGPTVQAAREISAMIRPAQDSGQQNS